MATDCEDPQSSIRRFKEELPARFVRTNVLAINGSPRGAGGITALILRPFLEGTGARVDAEPLDYSGLNHALALARRNSGEVAVMFLDLDGFKTVNDTQGHTAGDNLLQKVAKRLIEALRETDTVARLGGDEFTVIVPEIENREDISMVSQKILDKFITPFIVNGTEVQITTSRGVSYFPSFAMDGDTLVSQSDTAMYEAKRSGKNCYRFYDPAMN